MVKTVRITSIVVALLAVAILALPAVLSANPEGKTDQKTSNIESVVEKFRQTQGQRRTTGADQVSPLVKEAKAFALYLNPPPPKVERTRTPRITRDIAIPPVQPIARTAQFSLIATCVHKSNPKFSVALIDEPGQNRRWVRQSDEVGHLQIQQVKDGSVTINDGTRTYDLAMVQKPQQSSIVVIDPSDKSSTMNFNQQLSLPEDTVDSHRARRTTVNVSENQKPRNTVQRTDKSVPSITPQEQQLRDKYMKQIDDILVISGDDQETVEQSFKKADELMEKYLSELDNMRITGKEAQQLSNLGQRLDTLKNDPNHPFDRTNFLRGRDFFIPNQTKNPRR